VFLIAKNAGKTDIILKQQNGLEPTNQLPKNPRVLFSDQKEKT